KRLQEHRRFRPDRTEDIMDDQLEACMNESVRTADTYYSDSDNCMSFRKLGGADQPALLSGLEEDTLATRGSIVATSGQCYNTFQHEESKGRKVISLVDPSQVAGDSSKTRLRVFLPPDSASSAPSSQAFIEGFDGAMNRRVGSNEQSSYRVSVKDRFACPVSLNGGVRRATTEATK